MQNLRFTPRVIAHRGASAYAPENTMSAFVKTYQLGIRWIEFDVMLAACGTPVIFHDDTLDRTTNAKGKVHEFTFAELETFDAGSWFGGEFAGEKIPSLHAVMEFIRKTGLSANIELKPVIGGEEVLAKAVLNTVSQVSVSPNQLIFSSFAHRVLPILTTMNSTLNLGLLMHEWLDDWHTLSEQCVSVHLNEEIVTAEYVNLIKQHNKKILTYTVNSKSRAETLFQLGVDAVFSDNLLI